MSVGAGAGAAAWRSGRGDGHCGSCAGAATISVRTSMGCDEGWARDDRRGRCLLRWREAGKQLRHGQEENDERGESGCEREWAYVAAIHIGHGFSEDSGNAHAQSLRGLMAIESHCKTPLAGTLFFEPVERMGVHDGVRAKLQSEIVAAEFALVANVTAYPPDSRMEEKKSISNKGLPAIRFQRKSARRMCASSCARTTSKFFSAERCCGGNRQQHQSAKCTDGHRARDRIGDAQQYGAAQAHRSRKPLETGSHRGRRLDTRGGTQARDEPPATECFAAESTTTPMIQKPSIHKSMLAAREGL